jgi:hypothetical protein
VSTTKAKDALDTLGTILTRDEGRDAVHVAVVCCQMQSGTPALVGGDKVYLVSPDTNPPTIRMAYKSERVFGILDPFLEQFVRSGELFWVFLTPRTITSLKHSWTHPAFPEGDE